MHPRVLAEREQAAQARIEAAAQALSDEPTGVAIYDRDPATRALLRLEAVADLLEGVAAKKRGGSGAAKTPEPPAAKGPKR